MKIIKIILINLLILFSLNTYAISSQEFKNIYIKYIEKLEIKYDFNQITIILSKINQKVTNILDNKKLSKNNYTILNMILDINESYLKNLEKQKSRKLESINFIEKQIIYEKNHIEIIQNELNKLNVDKYAQKLISKNRKLFKVNDKYIGIKDGELYRVSYTKGYIINKDNYNYFKNKKGLIVVFQNNGVAHFVENYTLDKKYKYSELKDIINIFISDYNQYFLENNIYYTYNFDKTLIFNDDYGLFLSDLESNGITLSKDLLYLTDKGKFSFIKDYKKIKLISRDIIKNIKNKDLFLKEIIDDKKRTDIDYDKYFIELKKISNGITANLSEENKIRNIYNWVLQNTKYSRHINLNNYKIFSGIETFKNHDGVCEGYIKLMAYMLLFSGFEDIETIRGYVIDADDFPNIGHAWLKINGFYYDPTFDDPIGASNDLKYSDYKYFKLPKDLMYANRFDAKDLPEEYKNMDKDEITKIIFNNLCKLHDKYKNSNYNILKACKFALKYGLNKAIITFNDINKIFTIYDVNGDFSFIKDGKKMHIKKYKYFILDKYNINNIIKTNFKYDLSGTYLFNWKKQDGTYEYRLSYNLEF